MKVVTQSPFNNKRAAAKKYISIEEFAQAKVKDAVESLKKVDLSALKK